MEYPLRASHALRQVLPPDKDGRDPTKYSNLSDLLSLANDCEARRILKWCQNEDSKFFSNTLTRRRNRSRAAKIARGFDTMKHLV
jgi:hypothetical protein